MWVSIWAISIAMALGFSVIAMLLQSNEQHAVQGDS